MNGLASAGLITMDEACCIESTEAGRLMSIYYLDLETMKYIMKVSHHLSRPLSHFMWGRHMFSSPVTSIGSLFHELE